MRVSKLFGKTLRDDPGEAELISHKLMLKSGMIYQAASGIYSYMPLAWRSLKKIEQIIREEMDAAGGQEVHMPVLHPREIWRTSGRDATMGPELFRLLDRRERELVLAPTHEELLTNMVKANVHSYRDLPMTIYQIQTKFRDEPRPRGGLVRVREFDMKDAYSFDIDEAGLDESYKKMVQAYKNIFSRCELDTIIVDADSGAIGGKASQEFVLLADSGEDNIILCPNCEYAANAEKAEFDKGALTSETQLPLQKIHTPGVRTIEELTEHIGIRPAMTLKAVFYMADGAFTFVVIRGDLDVNEVKLKNTLGVSDLRLATAMEVKEAGVVAGSASPIGLLSIPVVVDDSVESGTNFVVGANKENYHLKNANFPRDFSADVRGDIALAQPGNACLSCGSPLETHKGIEVGHVFKLGTRYSEVQQTTVPDKKGEHHPIIMGCYGIGVGRLLAAAIEQNHDDRGIVFPQAMAPYEIQLVALNMENTDVVKAADDLYKQLNSAGLSTLFDDRIETAGVKFNDADLIGLPLRVVVSPRNVKNSVVEIKMRNSDESTNVPTNAIITSIKNLLRS